MMKEIQIKYQKILMHFQNIILVIINVIILAPLIPIALLADAYFSVIQILFSYRFLKENHSQFQVNKSHWKMFSKDMLRTTLNYPLLELSKLMKVSIQWFQLKN